MALGMESFIQQLKTGRKAGGFIYLKSLNPDAEGVVGVLNGPFSEQTQVNYEDFLQGNAAVDAASTMLQIGGSQHGKGLNVGSKATSIEKRQFSVEIILFNYDNIQNNVVKPCRELLSLCAASGNESKMYSMPHEADIVIGSSINNERIYAAKKVNVTEVRIEYGTSVDESGIPYYATVSISWRESSIPFRKNIMKNSTSVADTIYKK